MRETWYVLEDDEVVDPAEVSADETGRLIHSSGVPVAIRAGVPRSRGVDDPDAARAAAAQEREAMKAASKTKAGAPASDPSKDASSAPSTEPPKTTREMAADKPKRRYKTRGA